MSKKNLDASSIASELTGASIYFRKPRPQSKRIVAKPKKRSKKKTEKVKSNQSASQSTNQSTNQSTGQSVDQPTDNFLKIGDIGSVVVRPKSFYITEQLDKMLDEGVKYLQEEKGIYKADRSVLINALLHNPKLFTPKELDKLRERILIHLANKSLKRG